MTKSFRNVNSINFDQTALEQYLAHILVLFAIFEPICSVRGQWKQHIIRVLTCGNPN